MAMQLGDLLVLGQNEPAGRKPPAWLMLPEPRGFRPKRKVRTVWISDVHLGTRGCNAEMLVDFLRSIECETLCPSSEHLAQIAA